MIEVKDLQKSFGDAHILKGITTSFSKGKTNLIIGQSGSGKTSLLRMLAGLLKPDSGKLSLDGEAFQNPEDQLIAGHPFVKTVFQDYRLMPNMTVRENVSYVLLNLEESEKRSRTEELLDLCGLNAFSDKMPKELSGGQQQRLALARALAEDPSVLLMDEPFSNIDPVNKASLLLEIQNISKAQNVSLIFVTHDTQDAMLISDRMGFMQSGRLIQLDIPKNVYTKPSTINVARFMSFTI